MRVPVSGLNFRRIMTKKTDFLKYTDLQLQQDNSPYKINTDTIALGLFLDQMIGKSVLDIGCNSGALLLYALNKGATKLYGVDIHEDCLKDAQANLQRYQADFALYNCRVQDLQIAKCDVLICNPPFFEMNNVTPDPYLKQSMFEEALPLRELFACFRKLMKDNGMVYLIYQADRFPELYELCQEYKLKIMKMQFVHDVHSRHALRVLLKLKIGKMSKLKVSAPIMIDKGEFL